MIAKFWMVYGTNQGAPTARHKTQESALQEATRLARLHRGVDFIVLEAKTRVSYRDVDIAELEDRPFDDGIPF